MSLQLCYNTFKSSGRSIAITSHDPKGLLVSLACVLFSCFKGNELDSSVNELYKSEVLRNVVLVSSGMKCSEEQLMSMFTTYASSILLELSSGEKLDPIKKSVQLCYCFAILSELAAREGFMLTKAILAYSEGNGLTDSLSSATI